MMYKDQREKGKFFSDPRGRDPGAVIRYCCRHQRDIEPTQYSNLPDGTIDEEE